jgi:hypothetical protein
VEKHPDRYAVKAFESDFESTAAVWLASDETTARDARAMIEGGSHAA